MSILNQHIFLFTHAVNIINAIVQLMDKVLLVDGNNILHRSYHALAGSGLRGPQGEPIWAVHGLLNTLARSIKELQVDKFIIAFDSPEITQRKMLYPFYKGTRKPTPDDLKEQLALAYQIAVTCKFGAVIAPGWEADDIIASSVNDTDFFYILSSDRDAHQLLSDNVTIVKPEGGRMDPESFYTKYGFAPELYRHFAALVGESSDNINGVKGIGAVGATKIITILNSKDKLDNIEEHLELLKEHLSAKQLQLVSDGIPIYQRNLVINKLNTDLSINLSDISQLDSMNYRATLTSYGLNKVLKTLDEVVDNTLF